MSFSYWFTASHVLRKDQEMMDRLYQGVATAHTSVKNQLYNFIGRFVHSVLYALVVIQRSNQFLIIFYIL